MELRLVVGCCSCSRERVLYTSTELHAVRALRAAGWRWDEPADHDTIHCPHCSAALGLLTYTEARRQRLHHLLPGREVPTTTS